MTLMPMTGRHLRLRDKFFEFNWGFLFLLTAIASVGFAMLYSVADGGFAPWAIKQMVRFGLGTIVMIFVAMIDIRIWMRLSYPIYAVAFLMLVAVDVVGFKGMGAQRWLNLGVIQLQPSEVMKIALIMALARYYHGLTLEQVSKPLYVAIPVLLIMLPVALVVVQPDLGTAILLSAAGAALMMTAGLAWRYFIVAGLAGLACIPVAWEMLHDYQRQRVFTFLDPTRDPLGAGYHILQSKIALGSGGLAGKGFMEGTQAHLNFLPEKHTDFIFTMLGEELGLLGGITLLVLYFMALMFALHVARQSRNHYGRLVAIGVCAALFLYVFINCAMVMGLLPVVGVPLPLVSYGGTAMLSLMFAFGLLMSVYIHRNIEIPRAPSLLW